MIHMYKLDIYSEICVGLFLHYFHKQKVTYSLSPLRLRSCLHFEGEIIQRKFTSDLAKKKPIAQPVSQQMHCQKLSEKYLATQVSLSLTFRMEYWLQVVSQAGWENFQKLLFENLTVVID